MARSDKTIVLFTTGYPYNSTEHSFLKNELKYLEKKFKKVYIVPENISQKRFPIPDEISVDESLAEMLKKVSIKTKIQAILSMPFIKELFRVKWNAMKIRYAIAARVSALITQKWITNFLRNKELDSVVLYSFWFDFTTIGAVMCKRKNSNLIVVARCHNFDLYGNEQNDFYVPFQNSIINFVDGIYPDSKFGEKYITDRFPLAKCRSALMGVSKGLNKGLTSSEGETHIVSCAYMIKRKRVGLLMDALIYLSKRRPDIVLKWTHIGEGPEWDTVSAKKEEFEGQVKAQFLGNMSNDDLLSYYSDTPIDLFVNTSTKEGTPVSIMEAISFGIPIMATEFGGNKEIIEEGAGVLLSPDPSIEEIGDKLAQLIDTEVLPGLRESSFKVWENSYNSDKNYKEFCEILERL